MTLAQYLKKESKHICQLNNCTEDNHNCESYAYIRWDLKLLDTCYPDYFRGCSQPHAAIPLPFSGSQEELEEEVKEQCYESVYWEGHNAGKEALKTNRKYWAQDNPYTKTWAAKHFKEGFLSGQTIKTV